MYDWKFAGYESFPPTGTERIENGDTSGEVCVILVTRFPSDLSPTRRLNLSRARFFLHSRRMDQDLEHAAVFIMPSLTN